LVLSGYISVPVGSRGFFLRQGLPNITQKNCHRFAHPITMNFRKRSFAYFYQNLFVKKFQPLLLAILSGLLLFAAWPVISITPLIFISFVPLLWVEQSNISKIKYWLFVYCAMFVWNTATTWWIWNASSTGAIMAILANSFLMCLPWIAFRYVKTKAGNSVGYVSLIAFWLCFEYLHLQDWGLSWPWLTLGNIFAANTNWIQWYEYTGVSGGSLWVMIVNVIIFQLLYRKFIQQLKFSAIQILPLLLTLIVPIFISFLVPPSTKQSLNTLNAATPDENIVVVQPNIDPYEKLATGTFEMQLQKLIRLSESKIDSNTRMIIWPETALYSPNGFDEANLTTNFFLNPLFDFLKKHPHLQLFTGIESYRLFNKKTSNLARPIDGTSNFYEVYNGSVLLDSSGAVAFYHKSMLVPGVETLPRFLLFLAPVFEKFGGTAGGYAGQKERTPLKTNSKFVIAPSICYESIYGEYMSRYISNGANMIAIITNDGWWGNTPGYRHHQLYAKLRAIETRTWVARSANTGISCFIDPLGNSYMEQPWWTEAAIKMNITPTSKRTFFVRFGDVIGKLSGLFTILITFYLLYRKFNKSYTTCYTAPIINNFLLLWVFFYKYLTFSNASLY
jgi:apolipoprotein N-acyltransferase